MPDDSAARLMEAIELHEAGREMTMLRLRREHPDWRQPQVDEALARWLASAPLGPGRPVSDERWTRVVGRATDRRT